MTMPPSLVTFGPLARPMLPPGPFDPFLVLPGGRQPSEPYKTKPRIEEAPAPLATPPATGTPIEEATRALREGRDVEPSFRLIFETFERPLSQLFARRSVPVDERSDLVQETFLRVHREIGSFRGECELGTWIFAIAINLHRRHLRRRRGAHLNLDDPAFGLDERLSDPAPNPYETVHDEETQDTLWRLVDQLPPKMRRCLVLRIRHELKIREIATVLGLAPDTVKAHLHGARRRLRQMAEARGVSPDGGKNARFVAGSQSRVSSR